MLFASLAGNFHIRFRATGSEAILVCLQCVLGDAYRVANRTDDALSIVDEGLHLAASRQEGFREAELHRLKGVILLSQSNENSTEAEQCFYRGIEVARKQQSKSMELRISTDLGKMFKRQGKAKEARELVAPIYASFTEGFDTRDLEDAKSLLHSLN